MAQFISRVGLLMKKALHPQNCYKKLCVKQNMEFIHSTVTIMAQKKNKNTKNKNKPRIDTLTDVYRKVAIMMGIERGYKDIPKSRAHLYKYLPKSQDELEPRSMQDSFSTAIIPLSTDAELQDKYISTLKQVRLGRLLEDMDIFTVCIVDKHIKIPKQKPDVLSPYSLVTLLVDKIEFTNVKPIPNEDIKLTGHVCWVGKTSVEIVVWLEQKINNRWKKITRAIFLMAARDPCNTGPAIINPIKPANEREEEIYSGGLKRKEQRIIASKKSLNKVIPTKDEQNIIHDLFLRTMPVGTVTLNQHILPPNCKWMSDCTLSNIILSHPENRNLHNKVFGGFIMRQAQELSYILAYMFGKHRPELKLISDIYFHHPIDVSSVIRYTAYIVYTQMQFVQICVYADTFDSGTKILRTTNEFHFTYIMPERVPEVFPNTYLEAMMYLAGKRILNYLLKKENMKLI